MSDASDLKATLVALARHLALQRGAILCNWERLVESGGVRLVWMERSVSGVGQWMLCVQDTGPGFQPESPAAPLEDAMREATAGAQHEGTTFRVIFPQRYLRPPDGA
jgi:hypothetical protein